MKHHTGSIEVITGSMFCGKTDELIRRLRRAKIARQKVQVFKPVIDNRYAVEKVKSHAGSEFDAVPIQSSAEILERLEPGTTVVGVDEAQFFDARDRRYRPKTGRSRRPCDRRRSGYRLPRRAVWADANADGQGGSGG